MNLVRDAVTQPLRDPVPADDAAYLRRKGPLRLAVRTLRRVLQFRLSGQAASLRTAIAPDWKRALWIHDEAPQIGDALMDLAPRSLLHELGISVDLLAPPHIAALFRGDRWLRDTYDDECDLAADYQFVIASSHLRRALRRKREALPALPWVSLAGYYTVPDYQRSMFVARRLAALSGIELDAAMLRRHARQKLSIGPVADRSSVRPALQGVGVGVEASVDAAPWPQVEVAIAVGGVRADRSYAHWPEVVSALVSGGVRSVRLVGSDNGRAMADRIVKTFPAGATLDDQVARLDLHATQRALRHANVVLAADGGLMHIALTTTTPVIALFTSRIDPAWRLPLDFEGAWLRAETPEVSDLAPARVAEQASRRLSASLR